ncbi:hypothetical protein GCM10011402_21200 [Paracoccus acridae]|uniref:ATP-sulfurylase PUA-like domain-containing protein n=1 Tax=Paracoccus acridae TaxID=1795310 RepID=A0ABQ1VHR6_9RHOB|nr:MULTISPECIES: hypothetical protein [Paracoccus]GGF68517.1 hypothetical protein GCM10011402_21200 [Paracoccus acridae]
MMIRELYVSPEAAAALLADSARLPAWTLDAQQAGDLALLMNGAYAPLRGYMTRADHDAVQGGAVSPWPVPLALQVDADFAARVQPGDDIALRDEGGVVAVMSVTDAWGDPVLLGGRVKGLRRPATGGMTPTGLRALIADRGKARVLAVQPDRPEQLAPALRAARDLDALLLVQPLPGVALDAPDDAILSPLPVAPPKGPRAALWQALVARNHGATHLMLFEAAARELYRPHEVSIGVRMVEPGTMP